MVSAWLEWQRKANRRFAIGAVSAEASEEDDMCESRDIVFVMDILRMGA